MFRSTAVNYLKLTINMIALNIKSAMEYRISFITQLIAMIIGDCTFGIMWFIFFQRFPIVQGWTFQNTMLLLSLSSLNLGLVTLFASGTLCLAQSIANGNLDYQLSLPKNLLWLVATSKTNFAISLGDLVFGVIAYFFAGSLTAAQLGFFIFMVLLTALIIFNFIVITQSIGFFVGNFKDAAEQLFFALIFGTYTPSAGIHGVLKCIMMTIIPVLLIGTIPVQLIRSFNWPMFLSLIGVGITSTILALFIFKKGLKRYESGNLIDVKL